MSDLDTFDVIQPSLESELSCSEKIDDPVCWNYGTEAETDDFFAMGLDKGEDILIDSRIYTDHLADPEVFGNELKDYQPNFVESEKLDDLSYLSDGIVPTFDDGVTVGEVDANWTAQSDSEVLFASDVGKDLSGTTADLLFGAKEEQQLHPVGGYLSFDLTMSLFSDYLSYRDSENLSYLSGRAIPLFKDGDVGLMEERITCWSTQSNVKDLVGLDTNDLSVATLNTNAKAGLEFGSYVGSEFQNKEDELVMGISCEEFTYFPKYNPMSGEDLFMPDLSKNQQKNFASYDYDESFIEELSKTDVRLTRIYKGVIEINCIKPSDYKRHVADGFRELISNTIRILAPQDNIVKEWLLKTNRKQLLYEKHGKLTPTRKAKIIYIFRDYSKRERKLVEDEAKCLNRLYHILNDPTHSLTTSISGKLLDNYIQKAENSLKTLILLHNN